MASTIDNTQQGSEIQIIQHESIPRSDGITPMDLAEPEKPRSRIRLAAILLALAVSHGGRPSS